MSTIAFVTQQHLFSIAFASTDSTSSVQRWLLPDDALFQGGQMEEHLSQTWAEQNRVFPAFLCRLLGHSVLRFTFFLCKHWTQHSIHCMHLARTHRTSNINILHANTHVTWNTGFHPKKRGFFTIWFTILCLFYVLFLWLGFDISQSYNKINILETCSTLIFPQIQKLKIRISQK